MIQQLQDSRFKFYHLQLSRKAIQVKSVPLSRKLAAKPYNKLGQESRAASPDFGSSCAETTIIEVIGRLAANWALMSINEIVTHPLVVASVLGVQYMLDRRIKKYFLKFFLYRLLDFILLDLLLDFKDRKPAYRQFQDIVDRYLYILFLPVQAELSSSALPLDILEIHIRFWFQKDLFQGHTIPSLQE